MGTGVGLLHSQEGADALDLALEATVGQSLAFGAQSTRSHPLSVLLLLRGARVKDAEGRGQRREETKIGVAEVIYVTCLCDLTFSHRR